LSYGCRLGARIAAMSKGSLPELTDGLCCDVRLLGSFVNDLLGGF
jgi:hypothetical protein